MKLVNTANTGMLAVLMALAGSAWGQGAAPAVPGRGELLYANHCVECHTRQMHWRDARLARDWNGLRGQVARWQAVARLNWSAADIEEVTRHLNDSIYRFDRPTHTSALQRTGSR